VREILAGILRRVEWYRHTKILSDHHAIKRADAIPFVVAELVTRFVR
jgi:hypothetical protein